MTIGLPEAVILLLIVLILFGAGKVPSLMGDLARGIKTFKNGMRDGWNEESAPEAPPRPIKAIEPPVTASRADDIVRG
jgi:sec-independent protein translocase protein TatA